MERESKFILLKQQGISGWLIFVLLFAIFPFFATSEYQVKLANKIMTFSLFAVSFNLLYGYTGMLSFGQAAFYGLGGYAVGMLMTKTTGCPFPLSVAAGMVLGGLGALALGPLCIRMTGVFFTMLTLAFAELLWGVVFKWYSFTGGDNGIQGIPLNSILENTRSYYYFTLVIVGLALYFCLRLVRSPFGLILKTIHENPIRTEFIGLKIKRYQLAIFLISGILTGLAGALFAGEQRSIHPDMLHWPMSGEVILMAILGGFSTFWGPSVGAGIILFIQDIIGAKTEYWEICIGVVMLAIVILLPRGVVGTFQELGLRSRKEEPE